MPILLDDIQQINTNVKTYSPKFFSDKLTGSGKKVGLLNEARNPINIIPTQTTASENIRLRKKKYSNGQTDVTLMPINILTKDAWELMDEIERPDIIDLKKIATKKTSNTNNADINVYLDMKVHSLVLEETAAQTDKDGNKVSGTKILTACYHIFLYLSHDDNKTGFKRLSYIQKASRATDNVYFDDLTCNPLATLSHACEELTNQGYTIDNDAVIDFINNYEIYVAMVKRSEEWQTTIDKTLDKFFENVATHHYVKDGLNTVTEILRNIEDYNVPLELYKHIYKSVKKHFKTEDATIMCKQNLNLLLSDTLNNLEMNKAVLSTIATPNPPVAVQNNMMNYSKEQIDAITAIDPLILVQAGAGTGKSTVIRGRINYMIAAGVNPNDITVLSFTNAAADNITATHPNIHSMTIARMIHTIYSANFPQHDLSSIDTIINSIDIYFPNDDIAMRFQKKLYNISKNESDGFTSMNNFIEHHYAEVMTILDTIKQTSLELEIIVCYQQIDNLVEPPEIASKFLIIDEVQDNSIFEFIYTLKYVDKHKESLFIVGDCSQTLYEFRASNPKALNVLEGSGVFTAYQLKVNYRSNQEILDFANVALQNIEANQYANIQLQANSFAKVTEQSFTEKVNFSYHRLNKITEFNDALSSLIVLNIKSYIDDKLAKGEQVAFLAFTRNHVYKIQAILEHMYPDKIITNLVPDKVFNSTIFSMFIKKYWDQIQFVPTQSIINIISQEIIAKLSYLTFAADKALAPTQRMLANWQGEQQAIINSWQQQLVNNQMTQADFLNNVRENMLQFEIKTNAIRQALLSTKNEQNKKNQNITDSNILLSTIHSAKGLEFDNVVVIYKNETELAEDKKRMYYVAFTRAMKSEYILAYDTTASPKIEADYKSIVKSLHDRAANNSGHVNISVQVITDAENNASTTDVTDDTTTNASTTDTNDDATTAVAE